MSVDCQNCTEGGVNSNYTLHTGELTVCLEGESNVRDIGNVKGLDLVYTPEFVEHFRGSDGSLDAVIPLRKNYGMNVIAEELTPANFALLVGGSQAANTPSGCIVPLNGISGDCSLAIGAVEFYHQFPCGDKTLTVTLWRAQIAAAESTLSFGEDILEVPINMRALPCSSRHPNAIFGQAEFSQSCVFS